MKKLLFALIMVAGMATQAQTVNKLKITTAIPLDGSLQLNPNVEVFIKRAAITSSGNAAISFECKLNNTVVTPTFANMASIDSVNYDFSTAYMLLKGYFEGLGLTVVTE